MGGERVGSPNTDCRWRYPQMTGLRSSLSSVTLCQHDIRASGKVSHHRLNSSGDGAATSAFPMLGIGRLRVPNPIRVHLKPVDRAPRESQPSTVSSVSVAGNVYYVLHRMQRGQPITVFFVKPRRASRTHSTVALTGCDSVHNLDIRMRRRGIRWYNAVAVAFLSNFKKEGITKTRELVAHADIFNYF